MVPPAVSEDGTNPSTKYSEDGFDSASFDDYDEGKTEDGNDSYQEDAFDEADPDPEPTTQKQLTPSPIRREINRVEQVEEAFDALKAELRQRIREFAPTVQESFEAFDVNGDGRILAPDMSHIMKECQFGGPKLKGLKVTRTPCTPL